ncbi:hypothetical protein D3C85_1463510 [compost metagenome]
MQQEGTVSLADGHLFLVTDSIEEALNLIREKSIKQYELKAERRVKPFRWLFERS